MSINILHISDLHYCEKNKNDIKLVLKAMFDDVRLLIESENITPDIIVFSGDLVFSGDIFEDFNSASDALFKPLFQLTGLSKDQLVLAPGNHEVERNKIIDYVDNGIKATLSSNKKLNSYLDDWTKNSTVNNRLANFNNYVKENNSKFMSLEGSLCWTHKFDLKGRKVGVASLNCSWAAYGGDDDYGKLLLGERQIDIALQDIADCDLKICNVHHPFSWLASFERTNIKKLVYGSFDLLLTGHTHERDLDLTQNFNNYIVVSNSGCLYNSRDYYNGYSMISYDAESGSIEQYFRTYFDEKRGFDKAVNFCKDGKVSFSYNKEELSSLVVTDADVESLSALCKEQAETYLISKNIETSAPKNILEIYVEPPLANEQETEFYTRVGCAEKTSLQYIKISEVLKSDRNYQIFAKKESGKTLLLRYMSIKYLEEYYVVMNKMPIYLDMQTLPSGKDPIYSGIICYLDDAGLNLDVKKMLNEGKFIFFIDNFNFENNRHVEKYNKFFAAHTKCRYISAVTENITTALEIKKKYIIEGEYEKIFIHSMNRKSIRLLVSNWFVNTSVDKDRLVDEVIGILSKTNIPRNPVNISLILFILEREFGYIPYNKSAVLEKFLDILLGKHADSEGLHQKLDFRHKEHYLMALSSCLDESNNYLVKRFELEKLTIDYFDSIGLDISVARFIDYFISKGVLVQIGDMVSFRYTCFFEYYLAKQFLESGELLERRKNDDKILLYDNEIDYMTGLVRNDKNMLLFFSDRLKYFYDQMGEECQIDYYKALGRSAADVPSISTDLEPKSIDDETLDDLLEIPFQEQAYATKISIRNYDDVSVYHNYLRCLTILSKAVRNSELLKDKELRFNSMQLCVKHWVLLTNFILKALNETKIDEIDEIPEALANGMLIDENSKRSFMMIIPAIIQTAMTDYIGTDKIKYYLNRAIELPDESKLVFCYYLLLYSDLRFEGYSDRILRSLRLFSNDRFCLELLRNKLTVYLAIRKLGRESRSKIRNLIAEIITMMNSSGSKAKDVLIKNKVLAQLSDSNHSPSDRPETVKDIEEFI